MLPSWNESHDVNVVVSTTNAVAVSEITLPDGASKAIEVATWPGGAIRAFAYRDRMETWFRYSVHLDPGSAPVLLSMLAAYGTDRLILPDCSWYLCRGWIGCTNGWPAGATLSLRECIEPGDGSVRTRTLISGPTTENSRFLRLPPLRERRLAMDGLVSSDTVSIRYEVDLSPGSEPLDLQLLLSPRFLTDAEWAPEEEALARSSRILELSDDAAVRRFADAYLNSASDYVEAHLPSMERVHCYLQAALVRDWYREVINEDPEIDRVLRLTGLRRTPAWQSSNLLTPRDGLSVKQHLNNRAGVVLDTWRVDGGTATKLWTVDEFHYRWNRVLLENTVVTE